MMSMLKAVLLEDAWSGGPNLEVPLDHSHFETGESNAGPHSTFSPSVAGCEDPSMIAPYMNHRSQVEDMGIPCGDSYRSAGDYLVSRPSDAMNIVGPLMDQTGATCPSSVAQALADIIHFANMERFNEQ